MANILMGQNLIAVGQTQVDTSGVALDLAACVAKLDRAVEHLRSINEELVGFFESHPYVVTGEFEADSCWYVFTIREAPQPSLRLGVLVGEYVHQLRSVFDHWLTELRRWELGSQGKTLPKGHLTFPIYTSPKKFKEYLSRKAEQIGALPEAWQDLIKALQPCNRTGEDDVLGLALINELWNADKHASLYVAPAPRVLRTFGPNWTPKQDVSALNDARIKIGQQLVPDTQIARVRVVPSGTNPQVEMHGSLPVTVEVGKSPSRKGTADLSWSLFAAGTGVEGFLRAFPTGPGHEDSPFVKNFDLFAPSFEARFVTA